MDRQKILDMVGENVRRYRREQGLSQEKLAAKCLKEGSEEGRDRTYISGIERGVRNPTIVVLAEIAEALKIPPAALLETPKKRRK